MGNRAGEIHVMKITQEGLKAITVLKGHSDTIQALTWDAEKKLLYSGSFDRSIIIWDIGGQKGSAVELHGHMGRVKGVALASHINKLFSVGDDQVLVVWNTEVERAETPTWSQSDICEACSSPFFWNFRQMWQRKIIGVRQHHCRKCGRAICLKCSQKSSTLPLFGYEFEVKVCESCFSSIEDDERTPTVTFHEMKHGVNHLNIDISKGRLLTCGQDSIIKVSTFFTSKPKSTKFAIFHTSLRAQLHKLSQKFVLWWMTSSPEFQHFPYIHFPLCSVR